jgi:hypothetical protein
MANNSTHFPTVPSEILLLSVIFKFIAMIIGVLGNVTVIIYTIFLSKEKTATSYLVGNLALANLLVCLTFYPIWIIEFVLTILNIDSDQDLFCKLGRSTIWSLLFASVTTLLAITVDRYLYIVKPLKYPLIVTKRRVFLGVCKSRNPTRNTRNPPGTPGTLPGTPGTPPGTPGTPPGTPGTPPRTPRTPPGTRWNTSYEATHVFLYKFTCFTLNSG